MLSRVQLRTDWKTAQFPSIWSQWSAACLKGLAKQEPDFWGSPSLWSYPSDPSHLPSFLSPLNNLLCSAPPNWRVSDPKTKVCPGEGRVKADSTFISLFPRHINPKAVNWLSKAALSILSIKQSQFYYLKIFPFCNHRFWFSNPKITHSFKLSVTPILSKAVC